MTRPTDTASVLSSVGCLMLLIPIVLILIAVFVLIAIKGGLVGIAAALFLVSLVAVLVSRARRR